MNQNPPSFLPPPLPAATASISPATIWTRTTTSQLSGLELLLSKASGLEPLEFWNSGTAAAAVAAMFSSLQLGAFEHHWVNKLQQEDTSPAYSL